MTQNAFNTFVGRRNEMWPLYLIRSDASSSYQNTGSAIEVSVNKYNVHLQTYEKDCAEEMAICKASRVYSIIPHTAQIPDL